MNSENNNGENSIFETGVPTSTQTNPTNINTSPQPVTTPAPVAPVAPQPVVTPAPVAPVAPQPVVTPAPAAPVAPQPVVAPAPVAPVSASGEQVVIETVKEKKSSNGLVILLIIALFATIYFIDDITSFLEKNVLPTNPTTITDIQSSNLVDGFIKINDSAAYIKLKDIKFYNFKKTENALTFSFSYAPDKTYEDVSTLKIYIELYDKDKNILFKNLFDTNNTVNKDVVKTYSFGTTSDVYSEATYALVKIYSEKELNSKSSLTCKLKDKGEGYNVLYKNTYNFVNNSLVNYEVVKQLEIIAESTTTKKYATDIKKEYDKINSLSIVNTYENNVLTYNIDLATEIENYIPLYEKDATPIVIKNKETLKKWECE